MKIVYTRPRVEVIRFAPSKAIALEQPGWDWEDNVFSTPEARIADGKDAERSNGHEG